MSTKATSSVEVGDPTPQPEIVRVLVRGVKYTFTELEIGEYDKVVKQASHEEADVDGVMQDVTDNSLLLKLLVFKSMTSPRLTLEEISKLPTRASNALMGVVNVLHRGSEPVIQLDEDGEPVKKETPKGNA